MMKNIRTIIWGAAGLLLFPVLLTAESPDEIAEKVIQKMDDIQRFDTLYSEGSLSTTDRFGKKESRYRAWSRGGESFLIEFTNAEEKGQKILRVDDELYLFYPDAEDIIPMHGSALKQSMFGDISYEDITKGRSILDKYKVEMIGGETVDAADCWVIGMTAKGRDVPYFRQVVKVGKDDYILRSAEYYARSGKLLKTLEVTDMQSFEDGRVLLTGMVLKDQLRRGSRTEMRLSKVEINPPLDDELFSLQSLY